jgi:type II secretory pathway pseudopilin PulG
MNIMGVLSMTITPNWQHHSTKDAKRTLKPQALRDAKRRTKALIKHLLSQSNA